ncbi:MAG TPA: S8 family peptidase [Vicinamibacterales bacterium]|nr:S8 family peptidase [Vicinamibacterales bacterium]
MACAAAPAAAGSTHRTRLIVTLAPGRDLPASLKPYAVGRLDNAGVRILDVPDANLPSVASGNGITVHDDRIVVKQDFRTDVGAGSFFATHDLGFTGRGVTVAVLDSGVDASHDDLRRRVIGFADFVNGRVAPYDDNGHGTHVSGIIAGSGVDSRGQQAGVAPEANLVSLKVLDANGVGRVSDVLAALDWVLANADRYGIRVVNISFAAAIKVSYNDDELTQTVKKLVDRGIIVVAAAGNHGVESGREVFGGIGAPANAPWVITVGAASSMGTLTRGDDTVADFSSRGPTWKDFAAKPDLVSGGVGIISTSAPGSTDYRTKPEFLLPGTRPLPTLPYQVMTGTSMAAPSVAGAIALMLQANPRLTPNFAKAILEYTAQWNPQYRALEQGAGFLNALGAVRLSAYYARHRRGEAMPVETIWSRHINWGNHRVGGGLLAPRANAWPTSVTWGDIKVHSLDGDENIIWGTSEDENIVWGTADTDDNIIWGTDGDENIVWGTECGGDNCENIIWGTDGGDENIIWGTDDGDENIIWGTAAEDENIIWGTDDGDENIIWGTDGDENIIWGTIDPDPANVLWSAIADTPVVGGANPSFVWFLSRRHDASWIAVEFGDTLPLTGPGR